MTDVEVDTPIVAGEAHGAHDIVNAHANTDVITRIGAAPGDRLEACGGAGDAHVDQSTPEGGDVGIVPVARVVEAE